MGATFLLLLLLVQVATAMTARSAADAAVAATAREASLPGADLANSEEYLARALSTIVPGAHEVTVDVRVDDQNAIASASFVWTPPGPLLSTLTISVRADVPRVFEP